MSLEQKIEALTAAVLANTQAILALQGQPMPQQAAPAAPVNPALNAYQAPPAPAAPEMPQFAQQAVPAAPATVMPPPPSFAAPAAPAAPAVPFSDGKGLVEYVMASYKELGPDKGQQIQNVLTSLGYANINDVKPEHYPALYAGVQALKA